MAAPPPLGPRQARAAILKAAGYTDVAVARELEVGRGTVRRWRQLAAFQDYQGRIEQQARLLLEEGIARLALRVPSALAELLEGGNALGKLGAVRVILDRLGEPPPPGTVPPLERLPPAPLPPRRVGPPREGGEEEP